MGAINASAARIEADLCCYGKPCRVNIHLDWPKITTFRQERIQAIVGTNGANNGGDGPAEVMVFNRDGIRVDYYSRVHWTRGMHEALDDLLRADESGQARITIDAMPEKPARAEARKSVDLAKLASLVDRLKEVDRLLTGITATEAELATLKTRLRDEATAAKAALIDLGLPAVCNAVSGRTYTPDNLRMLTSEGL